MVSLHLPQKFQLKILIFYPPSEVSKIAKGYVNTFETCVCMQDWEACTLASNGYEGVRSRRSHVQF
jgi:hypothetical protein